MYVHYFFCILGPLDMDVVDKFIKIHSTITISTIPMGRINIKSSVEGCVGPTIPNGNSPCPLAPEMLLYCCVLVG